MHGASDPAPVIDQQNLSKYAAEVLMRLNDTIGAIDTAYREYQFNIVAQRLYDFVWSDYCDWFVEAAKTDIFGTDEAKTKATLAVMDVVLSATLRLLHPFMPHLTEEIWSLLGLGEGSIQFSAPPEKVGLDRTADLASTHDVVSAIYGITQAGRNLRASANIPSNRKIRFILRTNQESVFEQIPTLTRLLNAEEVALDPTYQPPAGTPVAVTASGDIFLPITAADQERERQRLDNEIAKTEAELQPVDAKLQNNAFVERAPAAVVEEHQRRRNDLTAQLAKLKQAREGLS
jgi:valyl-tRNA synthetase